MSFGELGAESSAGPGGGYLYLVAGTPAYGTYAYPVRLYAVRGRRLTLIRQIAEGLYAVTDDLSGHLYVLNGNMSALSVIHENAPEGVDAIPSPNGTMASAILPFSDSYDPTWGAVAGPGVPSGVVYAGGASPSTWRVARVFGEAIPGQPRVTEGSWDLYRYFRYTGIGGGPYEQHIVPGGNIEEGKIMVPVGLGPGMGMLGPTPPSLPRNAGAHTVSYEDSTGQHSATFRGAGIVADTPRFFALYAPVPSAEPRWPRTVYVLNKVTGRWSVIMVPYDYLTPRLFGPWLATTVEEPNPEGRESPGVENERANEVDVDTPTGAVRELPRVRGMYFSNVFMPGRLLLQNLVDGRKITINTGQQDSEVLDVRSDGLVLYRVNNEIFSAQIEGDKLGPATLIVKGDDVPEVHWVFWSAAKPPAAAPTPDNGTISGTVLDELSHPVAYAHVHVEIVGAPSIMITPVAETNAKGRFAIRRLRWGTYGVMAQKPNAGYPPMNTFGSFYGRGRIPEVTVSPQAPAATVVVRIGPKAAFLTATIVSARTGKPIKRARLDLRRKGRAEGFWRGAVLAHFTYPFPSEQVITLTVSAPGFEPWRWTVRMTPGERKVLTIRLRPLAPGPRVP